MFGRTYKAGEYALLLNKSNEAVVTGIFADDFEDSLGRPSLFTLNGVIGIDIENGVFNSNMWHIIMSTEDKDEKRLIGLIRDRVLNADLEIEKLRKGVN